MHRGFVRVLALAVCLPLCLIAAFDFLVDASGGHEPWSVAPLHGFRELGNRRGRARLLLEPRFEAVVIGSSRVSLGMDTDAVSLVDGDTANAGLMDTNLWELLRVGDFVLDRTDIHTIALCVDLHCLSSARTSNGDFERSAFAPNATSNPLAGFEAEAAELLSYRSLADAIACLERKLSGIPRYTPNGADLRRPPPGHRGREHAKQHLLRLYLGNPQTLLGFRYGQDRLRQLEEFLARAARQKVRVILAVPPIHALHLECKFQIGLWPQLDRMKRDLTAIGGRHGVPVVDFAYHHAFAEEPLPAIERADGEMRWWTDTSHCRPELGRIVLARLAAVLAGNDVGQAPLGVVLTPDSIEAHLAESARARDSWRQRNPDERAWIAELVHSRDLLWLTPPDALGVAGAWGDGGTGK